MDKKQTQMAIKHLVRLDVLEDNKTGQIRLTKMFVEAMNNNLARIINKNQLEVKEGFLDENPQYLNQAIMVSLNQFNKSPLRDTRLEHYTVIVLNIIKQVVDNKKVVNNGQEGVQNEKV